ncbi:DUF5335 family protein [Nannocystis pusilla]|uniref:DUF5335 domain-containing protein n=1 Tax=Nannocystis pusilla TaxID=889268 RepID=A0ABS7TQD4_9BACT|nr:DUF5335 family protein [Nannocystis pusilla]MBZ5710437.1 DUF5335 domain-containing protein [Nannocystis pusilla]
MTTTTRQLPAHEWRTYFDAFTRKHLRPQAESAGIVTIQAVSLRIGDQVFAENARLLGISYDPHGKALEVQLEGDDHMVFTPSEVWVLEGDRDDVIATFELVRPDGIKEILHVRGGGPMERVRAAGGFR